MLLDFLKGEGFIRYTKFFFAFSETREKVILCGLFHFSLRALESGQN